MNYSRWDKIDEYESDEDSNDSILTLLSKCELLRRNANELFSVAEENNDKSGYKTAIDSYDAILTIVYQLKSFDSESEQKMSDILFSCWMNATCCLIKAGNFSHAISRCEQLVEFLESSPAKKYMSAQHLLRLKYFKCFSVISANQKAISEKGGQEFLSHCASDMEEMRSLMKSSSAVDSSGVVNEDCKKLIDSYDNMLRMQSEIDDRSLTCDDVESTMRQSAVAISRYINQGYQRYFQNLWSQSRDQFSFALESINSTNHIYIPVTIGSMKMLETFPTYCSMGGMVLANFGIGKCYNSLGKNSQAAAAFELCSRHVPSNLYLEKAALLLKACMLWITEKNFVDGRRASSIALKELLGTKNENMQGGRQFNIPTFHESSTVLMFHPFSMMCVDEKSILTLKAAQPLQTVAAQAPLQSGRADRPSNVVGDCNSHLHCCHFLHALAVSLKCVCTFKSMKGEVPAEQASADGNFMAEEIGSQGLLSGTLLTRLEEATIYLEGYLLNVVSWIAGRIANNCELSCGQLASWDYEQDKNTGTTDFFEVPSMGNFGDCSGCNEAVEIFFISCSIHLLTMFDLICESYVKAKNWNCAISYTLASINFIETILIRVWDFDMVEFLVCGDRLLKWKRKIPSSYSSPLNPLISDLRFVDNHAPILSCTPCTHQQNSLETGKSTDANFPSKSCSICSNARLHSPNVLQLCQRWCTSLLSYGHLIQELQSTKNPTEFKKDLCTVESESFTVPAYTNVLQASLVHAWEDAAYVYKALSQHEDAMKLFSELGKLWALRCEAQPFLPVQASSQSSSSNMPSNLLNTAASPTAHQELRNRKQKSGIDVDYTGLVSELQSYNENLELMENLKYTRDDSSDEVWNEASWEEAAESGHNAYTQAAREAEKLIKAFSGEQHKEKTLGVSVSWCHQQAMLWHYQAGICALRFDLNIALSSFEAAHGSRKNYEFCSQPGDPSSADAFNIACGDLCYHLGHAYLRANNLNYAMIESKKCKTFYSKSGDRKRKRLSHELSALILCSMNNKDQDVEREISKIRNLCIGPVEDAVAEEAHIREVLANHKRNRRLVNEAELKSTGTVDPVPPHPSPPAPHPPPNSLPSLTRSSQTTTRHVEPGTLAAAKARLNSTDWDLWVSYFILSAMVLVIAAVISFVMFKDYD